MPELVELLPHLQAAQIDALGAALRWLEAEHMPLGILVTGSIVRGNPDANSDFDIVVLQARSGRQRVQRRFGGQPFEIFLNSPAWLRHTISAEVEDGRPVMAHMLTTGVLLLDHEDMLSGLIAMAREHLAQGLALSANRLQAHRYRTATLVEDALDLLPHSHAAHLPDTQLALHRATEALVEHAFYRLGRFLPRPKERIAELRRIAPGDAERLSALLAADGGQTAMQRLQEAASALVGATGFFEWDSDIETEDPSPARR